MPYTLVIGRDEDLCCRLVRESLFACGREVIYLPEDRLFPSLNLVWEFDGGNSQGTVGMAGQTAALCEIDGVLARFYGIATTAEDFQTRDGQYLSSEWHALLRGYMQAFACPVINRLRPELWYKSHLSVTDMISLVPGIKFGLPRAMVTTRMEDAHEFFRACGNRVRYSPLTLPSNYSIDTCENVQKLEAVSKLMPLFLSEVVPGDALSVFVVGKEAVFDPPPGAAAVGDHCAELAAHLGLTFCRFQLVRSPQDAWQFLGLETMPHLYECADEVRDTVVKLLTSALISGNGRRS